MSDNAQKEEMRSVAFEEAIDGMPGVGFFDDDIKAHLKETARSITQDIVDIYGKQYGGLNFSTGQPRTPPVGFWNPVRRKSYLIAAEHCEALAKNLRAAAKKSEPDF